MWNLIGLSLKEWSYAAQLIIAGAGALAVLGAAAQVITGRNQAKRERAFAYADRFNQLEIIAITAEYADFWKTRSYAEFIKLPPEHRSRLLVVPNLIEEMAMTYNANLLDRNAAAQMVGVLAESTWTASGNLVASARQDRHNDWIYAEWEEMQKDTARRRLAGRPKIVRRRARRRLFRGH
jgi:hypothetical protein